MDIRKKMFDGFNKFINEYDVDPYEVCMFIHSLLVEKQVGYAPTGCHDGEEWKLIFDDGELL